jgi:very-short-patch-repair endonuclease
MKKARSKLEESLDAALHELYPQERIARDMPVKVKGRVLYVDRVIRGPRIAIEIDGRQHSEYVAHFHRDADGYAEHKTRDRIKEQWLEDNGYSLVRFNYNEEVTAVILREKILKALQD